MIWVGMPYSRCRLSLNWQDGEGKQLLCVTLEEGEIKLQKHITSFILYMNFTCLRNLYKNITTICIMFGLDYPTK